jgi:glycosyltransferase involved in cell wall biosynthesis
MIRNDVAIYTASSSSAGLYDRARRRAGGAERQMTLLARALASRGKRVAHIVYPPKDPVDLQNSRLTLVHRAAYAGDRRVVGMLQEAARIWRALDTADARVAIIRTGGPVLGVAGVFCRIRGRGLIFSSANNAEFIRGTASNGWHRNLLYRVGIRLADAVVVQSKDQLELARRSFPWIHRTVHIPSFAETPASLPNARRGDAFLWVGRLVDYKRPLHYVELARALPQARFLMIPVQQESGASRLAELEGVAKEIKNLQILEPVPHSDLMKLISGAVAVVNTSVLEGMPNIFLEAWARGVPALTLEFDPDHVITTQQLGIAADGCWTRFVSAANELWGAREDRAEFSRRTRAYVEDVHSLENVGAEWNALVDRVAAERTSHRRFATRARLA